MLRNTFTSILDRVLNKFSDYFAKDDFNLERLKEDNQSTAKLFNFALKMTKNEAKEILDVQEVSDKKLLLKRRDDLINRNELIGDNLGSKYLQKKIYQAWRLLK